MAWHSPIPVVVFGHHFFLKLRPWLRNRTFCESGEWLFAGMQFVAQRCCGSAMRLYSPSSVFFWPFPQPMLQRGVRQIT
jgi:hypothetical protein